ncbi:TPA: hypothetical protein QDC27_004017 [Burkholderia cepacia ATCC 25416]|uniref:hypothetical protein n=1 Tax=Burkholderia cepacia TaxID=292 RepID=UPI000F5D5A94|nr:hypothetical protein [Burkholderia cepacia]HDR9767500.1 hypothetical protein [Burkholderia cepacia ATCC 25416]MCA8026567.1 hypothetical protein [Burkholderia cepacia]MCA8074727.1 hypothetical protein [Burkholderia cepacia]HDR9776211.1 hypothetical protein [Burkholderia cepacia ATCC 25416]HDR9783660.1 hypothetical protein [Burkholderia cepacia ATCC 25416]
MSNETGVRLGSLVRRGFVGGNVQFDDKRGELASYRSIEIYLNGLGDRWDLFLLDIANSLTAGGAIY